jgi:hypothetical protein
MSKSVGSLLRNTYATINKFKLDSTNPNLSSYLFLKGNDIPKYINENKSKILDNDIISIIDPNLNNIYWENRELLSITDLENLTDYMKQTQADFELSEDNVSNIELYNITSNIIDYNIVFITVKDFIKAINNNKSVIVKLPDVNINIEFQYELYDFYNKLTNNIENVIVR